MNRNRARTVCPWLVAGLVMGLTGGQVRAANLDRALLQNAPAILEVLNSNGYKNVGVLPFKVKKGSRPASYTGGPLAANLPGRLENALILCQSHDSKTPIGIIRDAAGVASAQKIGAWTRYNVSYKALFNTRYPLAWGETKVTPSAFLTGVVSNTGDRKATTVQVQVFGPDSRVTGTIRMLDVVKFEVDTDRALLRDLGYGYALPRSVLRAGVKPQQRDVLALQQIEEDDEDGRPAGGEGAAAPDSVAGMAFEIRYNGVKQTIRPLTSRQQGARGREWQIDPVRPATAVTMVLTRLLAEDRTLGVVLKVNGKSTWRMEEDESIRCKKWLYDLRMRGKPDLFEGFYTDTRGDNLHRFKVLTAAESLAKASEMGDRAGWIDIDVYAGGAAREEGDAEQALITTRGLARSGRRPATLRELRQALAKANNVRLPTVRGRSVGGLVIHEPTAEKGPPILTGSLANPVHLGGISIKYWDRRSDDEKRIED